MGLELAFSSRELRSICESHAKAKRELGEMTAHALQRHLADMESADTVSELFDLGLEIQHCCEDPGLLRFRLNEHACLACRANHRSLPLNGGNIDWAQVTRLQLVRVEGTGD